MTKGIVYLVGAGPGDPGLLTQRGLECLARAEVVVYDRLLDERILEAAPQTAARIYVGKATGAHTMQQEDINRLLVEKGEEGKTVVRLKGGDPFVFGRGGEEALALHKAGIPFEIVPGVSSAVAVPAYAGIPVTHRGLASSFAVVTGHEDPSKDASSIDWAKLATGVDTLVLLMGMKQLPEIVKQLVQHGRRPDTPVAIIKEGTRPEQVAVSGTLANIVAAAKQAKLGAPAVVVVGEVAGLRDDLQWYDSRPLSGKRVLVTRSRRQASPLTHLLAERGARAVELPAIQIAPLEDASGLEKAVGDIAKYDWLLFTSVNGVEACFDALRGQGRDARGLSGLKIGAIGPATAEALAQRGIIADYVPPVYTGRDLAAGLKDMGIAGQRFLLLRADIADDELAASLREAVAAVDDIAAYRTVPPEKELAEAKELLLAGGIDVVTFASSSTAQNLVKAMNGKAVPENVVVACIGPRTAEAAREAGLRVDVEATEHTITGLVAAIEEYYRKER